MHEFDVLHFAVVHNKKPRKKNVWKFGGEGGGGGWRRWKCISFQMGCKHCLQKTLENHTLLAWALNTVNPKELQFVGELYQGEDDWKIVPSIGGMSY